MSSRVDWLGLYSGAIILAVGIIGIGGFFVRGAAFGIGILVAVGIVVGPLAVYGLVASLNRYKFRVGKYLHGFIKTKSLLLALVYFFSISAFVGILSPVFVENAKEAKGFVDSIAALLTAIAHSGVLLAFVLIPVTVMSIVVDKVIRRLELYAHFLGGYIDPETNEENISLRYKTFFGIIEKLKDASSAYDAGEAIGASFAKSLRVHEMRFDGLIDYMTKITHDWQAVDEKAGWCDEIGYDKDTNMLKISRSFAKRQPDVVHVDPSVNKVCCFLAGYVGGIVTACPTSQRELVRLTCENTCSRGNFVCSFRLPTP